MKIIMIILDAKLVSKSVTQKRKRAVLTNVDWSHSLAFKLYFQNVDF